MSTSKQKLNRASVGKPNHHANPYVRSSLFSEVFLRSDVPIQFKKIWDDTSSDGIKLFRENFLNLIDDLKGERFDKWTERETIANWIVPIMKYLGWHDNCVGRQSPILEEESFTVREGSKLKGYRPDLLYVDKPKHRRYIKEESESEAKLREARNIDTGVKIVLEAKYWDKLEQLRQSDPRIQISKDLKKINDNTTKCTPDDQVLKYIEILKCEYGILSDGKTWRLFHLELSCSDVRRYYEFDLGNLVQTARCGLDNSDVRERFDEALKYFYYFFSKRSLIQKGPKLPFVKEVLQYSRKYCSDLEDDLKKNFLVAMTYACNGFYNSDGSQSNLFIRNVAESHLFNLIFLRSCEIRRILPIHSSEYLKISLTEIIDTLDQMRFDPKKKDVEDYLTKLKAAFGENFCLKQFDLYDRILNLYEIVTHGTVGKNNFGFKIEGFQESIFENEELEFLKKNRISNKEMLVLLFFMNFTDSKYDSRKYQQIPYNFLSPRQLGSIYESFLDFTLKNTKYRRAFDGEKWVDVKNVDIALLPDHLVVKKDGLIFEHDEILRKHTGSYYTPEEVVRYILEKCVIDKMKGAGEEDILEFKICDPALGSGHFLNSALILLTDRLIEELPESSKVIRREEVARLVLDSCLFGIDNNPRAVKLAKLSLWLVTAYAGKKLESLDDQLRVIDSLDPKNNWIQLFPKVFTTGGFDAVIGNPPYGANSDHDRLSNFYKLTSKRLSNSYAYFMELVTKITKLGGSVGFIVPNTWLSMDSCEKLRHHLFFDNRVTDLVLTHQIFQDISANKVPIVDTLIYKCERKRPKTDYSVTVKLLDPGLSIEERLDQLKSKSWTSEIEIDTKNISEAPKLKIHLGVVGTELDFNTFDLESKDNPKCFVRIGAQEYAVGKGKPPLTKEQIKEKPYHSNRKATKSHMPFVPCADVQRYRFRWSETYLKWGSHLHCPREKEIFSEEHLLVSRIFDKKAEKLKVCLLPAESNGEFYVNNTDTFNIYLKSDKSISLKYLMGVLNSEYVGQYLQSINVNLARAVYPKINTKDLKLLPIPNPSKKEMKEIEKLVTEVLKETSKKSLNQIKIRALEKKIDAKVRRLYSSDSGKVSAA